MRGLHHVGFTVSDLDASIRFYHDVLELPFANEPSPWFAGPGLGPAVGVPGAALRQVGPVGHAIEDFFTGILPGRVSDHVTGQSIQIDGGMVFQ